MHLSLSELAKCFTSIGSCLSCHSKRWHSNLIFVHCPFYISHDITSCTVSLRLWWSPIFFQKEENARRQARGDPPLPISEEVVEQELNLRPVNPPPRLEALLLGKQVDLRCHEITEIAGGTFAKLYLSEGLQPKWQLEYLLHFSVHYIKLFLFLFTNHDWV